MRKRNLLFGRECSLPLDLFVSTKIHPREIKINDMCNRFSNQEYFSLISSLRHPNAKVFKKNKILINSVLTAK